MTTDYIAAPPMTRYLQPLIRRWPLIVTFSVSAMLCSLAMTYVMSEKYVASAIVVLQPNEDISVQPKSRNALGFPLPLVPLESIANTLEDILRGELVLEKTVRQLRLDVPRPRKQYGPVLTLILDVKDWVKELRDDTWQILKYGRVLPKDNFRGAMINLQKNLSIRRTNKSYTVRLEAVDEIPERAALIVNTAGATLAETVAATRSQANQAARKNIETRLTNAAQRVQALRQEVAAFKSQAGVSALTQEVSLQLKSLNELQDSLARINSEIDAAITRKAQVEEQVKAAAPSVKYTTTTADNPVYGELRSEQAKLSVQLAGLLEKFTPEHEEVQSVRAKLKETEERLGKETPKLLSSESTRVSDIHTKLLSEQLDAEVALRGLRAKQAALQKTYTEQSQKTQGLVASEPKLESLMLQLQTEEKSYSQISEFYEEALLAESKAVPEVMVQSPALVPAEPARPIKILHVGTSLLLSLAIGIGIAFLAAFFEPKVHSALDAELALGLPVVGRMPAIGTSWPELAAPADNKS
ncbi:MAG: hypothetical protein JNM66_01040 [Bryobacterales bacterium]|nr:hypothetical protein [Bryobacterales bacterium]